jgi:fumarylacetoacetase
VVVVGKGPHRVRAAGWVGVAEDDPFGLQTLPFGVFTASDTTRPRVGVRVGERVLDLTSAAAAQGVAWAVLFTESTLDPFLAAGRGVWDGVRADLTAWLSDPEQEAVLAPLLRPVDDVVLLLPFTVADYVDFYASEHHASNLGALFRPGQPPLTPNWKHLPIGYHGRAGTVVVSGSPVPRPRGQRRTPDGSVVFGPSTRLDLEAEVGFVVGRASRRGTSVGLGDLAEHVFGVCLVNDWSARDVQAWEYVPLGPFLGKSFATSVSPWVVPLAALEAARVVPPARDPQPLPYLDDAGADPWGLDLTLEVRLNDTPLSRPPFATTYWTAAQMLAHLTVGGASLRTGDLFASGTVSGPEPWQRGSLIELSWNGAEPVRLADGTSRAFLEDGDEVVVSATAPGPGGTTVGFGEVRGRVLPAGDT